MDVIPLPELFVGGIIALVVAGLRALCDSRKGHRHANRTLPART